MTRIRGMYFSGTKTTEKVVERIADKLYETLKSGRDVNNEAGHEDSLERKPSIDFTPPQARKKQYCFDAGDVVIFGVPVIAGRVPNVLLGFLDTLSGGGALAIPVVLYGNRDFDDALIELRNILSSKGFKPFAAGAFIGEHSFSRKLAAGRPDERDLEIADTFAAEAAAKLLQMEAGEIAYDGPVEVDGCEPLRPYYKPRDRQGNHINILKVKPKLDDAKCDRCGICAEVCPMGSIKPEEPGIVSGICIKCCGCEKLCPQGALYFDDPGYLYHKEELELGYAERKEPKIFI